MAALFRCLFLLCVLFGTQVAMAQQKTKYPIYGDFTGFTFEEFARAVEAKTPYRFYFQPEELDSIVVQLVVQEKPLEDVLRSIFLNTDISAAIAPNLRVYVTKGLQVQLALPPSLQPASSSPATNNAVPAMAGRLVPPALQIEDGAVKTTSSEKKLYEIGFKGGNGNKRLATLSGQVRDVETQSAVVGAAVFLAASPTTGVTTDENGNYQLALPPGRHELRIRVVGKRETSRQVHLLSSGQLNIDVLPDALALGEVLVKADKYKNVLGQQMGMEKLDIRNLKIVPTVFGETDVLRVLLMLPGVKSVGEGSTGLNVRGGSADQNLILYNDAVIYNPSHLFGFFSAFNPDAVQSAEIYKSGIPARYGGRLASVVDVKTRIPSAKTFTGAGGIGLLTSRLNLEGPIIRNKTSFMLGGRTTYSDWLFGLLPSAYRQSTASFYDVNANISHAFNDKSTLDISGYVSQDAFTLNADTSFKYANKLGSVKWRHEFTPDVLATVTGSYSHYKYKVASEKNAVSASELAYSINQTSLQAGVAYQYNEKHALEAGVQATHYQVAPGSSLPLGSESILLPDQLPSEYGLEHAYYLSDKYELSPRLTIEVGLRYSFYHALGPKQENTYLPGEIRSENTLTGARAYGSGETVATYHGPEYRASGRFALNEKSSVKVSYNRMRQYLHMLSNTAAISPTDTWKLSDSNIKPQVGDQVALGFYRNFENNNIETSIETYYKWTKDFLDYKSGAVLLLNRQIEADLMNVKGKAYGVEFMVKRAAGKVNGWFSYTYSRSLVRSRGAGIELINRGEYYPSNFDKPHDFTLVGNVKVSHRFSASMNVTYSTGRPITLPIAKYMYNGAERLLYSDRNRHRIPDYFRVDVGMNIEGNHRIQKLKHSSWTAGVYNLLGRKNPYSVYFKTEGRSIGGYKLSIFGNPIPNVTYNFKF
ncbi:TonB-dependent receptor [Rufibacter sp. LB8]|uniref:TonB-dependent receptor n=1 Tax=Rufibacter sp. LB8 TaxID=2777781 RepID=UPI00178C40F4|nr:TonB-dependent receptor [Rufibacter sp. LB8]